MLLISRFYWRIATYDPNLPFFNLNGVIEVKLSHFGEISSRKKTRMRKIISFIGFQASTIVTAIMKILRLLEVLYTKKSEMKTFGKDYMICPEKVI